MAGRETREPAKSAPAKQAEAETALDPEPAVVARAGGHVDRGDGDGWVLEEE